MGLPKWATSRQQCSGYVETSRIRRHAENGVAATYITRTQSPHPQRVSDNVSEILCNAAAACTCAAYDVLTARFIALIHVLQGDAGTIDR